VLRYICSACNVKWFVPPGSPQPPPAACGACGGELEVLDDGDAPPTPPVIG